MNEDYPKDTQTIEGDREIPSIAHKTDLSKIGISAFVGIGLLAIILVAKDGLKNDASTSLVEVEDIEYQSGYMSDPYIDINQQDQSAKTSSNLNAPDANGQLRAQQELQLQQEALRIAREQQKRLEERRQSPLIVFDRASNTVNHNNPVHFRQNDGLGIEEDSNISFANSYASEEVETAQAKQLKDLHTLLTQGTIIEGILETAIQSDLPGFIRAIVSEDVYSFNHSHLLVPKGSKLVGRYRSTLTKGQSRVFVIWNRLIRPDGVSIQLGSYGTDNLGRSGLTGKVDTHFFERFGSSVLLSFIDSGLRVGANSLDDREEAMIALQTGNDFSKSAEIALENTINIPPTIHILPGTKINVFVGKDLNFSKVFNDVRK